MRSLNLDLRGSHGVDRVTAPRDLGQTRVKRVAGAQRVGVGFRRIQLQEQVSGLDDLASLDVDRSDLARIKRFDHLGVANCLDLARGCRMDVQPAEIRPHQRRQREGANRRHQRDRQRRGRSFEDFERGRQEFAIAPRNHEEEAAAKAGAEAGELLAAQRVRSCWRPHMVGLQRPKTRIESVLPTEELFMPADLDDLAS